MRFARAVTIPILVTMATCLVAAIVLGARFVPHAWSVSGAPPRPADAADAPLGVPVQAPDGTGGFTFMMKQDDGRPVKWDPCRPIHVVVNKQAAPAGADAVLADALARVTEITGQLFVIDGPTDEQPHSDRESVMRDRYGNQWAPVLVAWTSPEHSPGLVGDVAGYAGPMAMRDGPGQDMRYISGQVVLDGPQLGRILSGHAGAERTRAVVLHELAHLMGLEHVQDDESLMYPATTHRAADFAPGDVRGLVAVSGGRCF